MFKDHLSRVIGVHKIPLAYVIRDNVTVVAPAPTLATGFPHSTVHGSVEAEMIFRASHSHVSYAEDNSKVYYLVEEATRATQYAATIKPYQRGKDGRGAFLALVTQFAGRDKWEAEFTKQDDLLHTFKWKGQSNFPLERFVAQHRNAYVMMQQASTHVPHQLPDERKRVGFLLDAIESNDASLQAAMASIRADDTGTRQNFEAAVALILPQDPVAKRKKEKRKHPEVDGVTAEISAVGGKPATGKSGVEYRYYTGEEYSKLNKEQKNELREWRKKLKIQLESFEAELRQEVSKEIGVSRCKET